MYLFIIALAYILSTTLFVWTMAHYGFDSQHTMKFFYIALSLGVFSIVLTISNYEDSKYEIGNMFEKYCSFRYRYICYFVLFILSIFAFPLFMMSAPAYFFLGKLGELNISLGLRLFINFCVTFALSFIFIIFYINAFVDR